MSKHSIPILHAISEFVPFLFFNRLSVSKPRVFKFFQDLRANEATSLPVGVAGFCVSPSPILVWRAAGLISFQWGGKFTFLLCSDFEKVGNGKSLVDCGFAAHPSNLVIPADAEAVKLPLSVAVGDADIALPLKQVELTKTILEEKEEDRHEMVIIPGAKHGFAIRADPADEKAVEQGQQAEDQAVRWFTKWFAKLA